jgi:acyl-[acyl-carrier-protein]-phospholipid O-acyltransferase/long-chain-fatty-acid--[acyl-carrier-protein] ligase
MAESTSLQLLRARRFAPLFWTQALGAFNDNLFKQAMALLVAYRAGTASGLDAASLTAMAGATFVAPFIFLSAFAGSLADSMDKAVLARRLKLLELAIMAVAAVALVTGHLVGLFTVLFLLGCQAALFGPVKYSLLPTHLRSEELVAGNALVESATFIAILLGSILGGSLIGWSGGAGFLSGPPRHRRPRLCLFALHSCGRARCADPWSAPPQVRTIAVLSEAHANRTVWLSILGISWFWVVGATLVSFVPPLARDLLGGSEAVASFLLAVFSVGIAVGSQLCAKQLNGEITPRPVPFAALAMSGLLVLFALATAAIPVSAAVGQSLLAVLSAPGTLVVSAVLFALAVTAGFYAVPLFTILQHSAPEEAKARTIGANNVINSLMMVAAAVVTAALSSGLGLSLPSLALILAALNLVAAAIMLRLLSRIVLKTVVRALLSMVYGVETRARRT